jgi:hypothetical protein
MSKMGSITHLRLARRHSFVKGKKAIFGYFLALNSQKIEG